MNITDQGADWFYDYVWTPLAGSTSYVKGTRTYVERRQNYYDGVHDILSEDTTYANGQAKGIKVMNWIKSIIDRHAGKLSPFQITSKEDEEGNQTDVSEYKMVQDNDDLNRIDKQLIKDVFLCGYAVEFHAYDAESKQIKIVRYNPRQWAFIWDTNDDLQAAVYCMTLSQNQIYNGEVVTEGSKDIMSVYTADEIATYERTPSGGGTWTGEVKTNPLKIIPVVVWTIDEDLKGLVSAELIAMNNEFNTAFNRQGDDINNNVDNVMKIWGIDDGWAKDNEATIKEMRMMPFTGGKEEQDAEFVSRSLDIEPHKQHIADTRENIHVMGCIPDVSKIVGSTGATSGIALKLMFTSMREAYDVYKPYLIKAIRDRITLINARNKIMGKAAIEANIDIQFNEPTNRIEEWQNIGELDGIVSKSTQLELLSDITNPEDEMKNIRRESGETPLTENNVQIAFQQADAKIAEIGNAVQESTASIAAGVSSVLDAVRAAVTTNQETLQAVADAIAPGATE